MMRSAALLLLFALVGCGLTDPYERDGVWRPHGANDSNLRAMVVVPSDLVAATPASRADGNLAAAAVSRLRNDRVRSLPDSGVAQVVPVSNGTTAQPAAASTPGGAQ